MPGPHINSNDDRLRLGLVIYGSLDTVSGGYLYDRQMVTFLRRQGHQVEVISLPARAYALSLLDNFRQARWNQYDLLLQDELNHPSLFWLNRRLQVPVVSIVHHLRSSEHHPPHLMPLYQSVEYAYLNSVDAFVYNSRTTQATTEQFLSTSKPNVVAVPSGKRFDGLSQDQVIRRTARPRPLQVLFVGNLIPRKGLGVLLQALVGTPAHLTVIGATDIDQTYTQHIQRQIEHAGLSRRVKLFGRVTDTVLATAYADADVLVVPSQYEGFGIVYLEGMAFGLPAIGSSVGAAHEIITHQENGFLIAPGDATALTRCLQQLIHTPTLQVMSLAAWERARAHPTWDESAARIEAFLLKLAKKI